MVSQWVWNLRLELGHQLQPILCAPPSLLLPFHLPHPLHRIRLLPRAMLPRTWACPGKRVASRAKTLLSSPMGRCACPADQKLLAHEQRREADGSLRVVYGASIRSCRPCPLREQCQWHGSATTKPRQVSVLLHPLAVGPAPLLWRDWSRREHRRACMQLVRHQRIEVSLPPPAAASPPIADVILSRAQRAHSRLSWATRLARNGRSPTAGQITIKLFGVPEGFAELLGLKQT